MRVLQMPALGITRARAPLSLRHLISPKIPASPRLADEKATRMSGKSLPPRPTHPLHLGRTAIFLDRLNETMTAVSSDEREVGEGDGKKAKVRGK